MAQGFPSRNPARNKARGIRPPANSGSLMEWLSWNFPTVYAQASNVQQDSRIDFKSRDYARQHPTLSGRVP